jgi:hypothetical protein
MSEGELVRHGRPERESAARISLVIVTPSPRVRASLELTTLNFDQSSDAGKGRETRVAKATPSLRREITGDRRVVEWAQ